MALTASFSATQQVGQPSVIYLNDTSTGSDGAVVARRVFLLDCYGNFVVPSGTTTDYVLWSYSDPSIAIDCLTQDAALRITVLWVNNVGATLYTATQLYGFTLYNETFYYSMTQAQALQNSPPPTIIQDTNYYYNKMVLRVNIDSGNQAIVLADDITTAQNMYNQATYMVQHESDYF